ncbi:hypothetical protein DFH06DRAFT_1328185 [Mycena polygramma]|nr:hypothetical protein DFH06DRAFT_1328185 [Mycena polygramma]
MREVQSLAILFNQPTLYAVPKHTAPLHQIRTLPNLLCPFATVPAPGCASSLYIIRPLRVSYRHLLFFPNSSPFEMTSFPVPAATTAPSAHEELRAVIATVTELLGQAHALTTVVQELYDRLPVLVDLFNEEAADDNVFVRAPAKTPAQVAAEHTNEPDGSRPWWVVFVGREPGLYTTIESANAQIKGCPGQEYRRKTSKGEALAFYELKHDQKRVEKWVELTEEQ